MKKLLQLLATAIVVMPGLLQAQIPTYNWGASLPNSGDVNVRSIAVDDLGDVYYVGEFNYTIDCDPGAGTSNMTSSGGFDAFLIKLDKNGIFQYAYKIGAGGDDYAYAVAVDSSSTVSVAGNFLGTVDLDPTAGTQNVTSVGSTDAFLIRMNGSTGTYLQGFSIGGTGIESTVGLTIGIDNSVIWTGQFSSSTLDLNPWGSGTYNVTNAGGYDGFLIQMDKYGFFHSAFSIGGFGNEFIAGAVAGTDSSLTITGGFSATTDFDPGSGTYNLNSMGSTDIFLAQYDKTNTLNWVKTVGAGSADAGRTICIDAYDNIYVAGYVTGSVDLDPGAGVQNHSADPNGDVVIYKFNPTGSMTWAKVLASSGTDRAYSIGVDGYGRVYTVGSADASMDMDPGAGTVLQFSALTDGFISCLDMNGNYVHGRFLTTGTGGNTEVTYAVSVKTAAQVMLGGWFGNGTMDLDPTAATANFTATNIDGFIARWNYCETSSSSLSLTGCDTVFTVNGTSYSSSGTYTQTLKNKGGCDSILTINVTIGASTGLGVYTGGCDSFTYAGITYYTSGVYYQYYTNSVGCDSVVMLTLTITDLDSSVVQSGDTLTAVASGLEYQWVDCNAGYAPVVGATSQQFIPAVSGTYAVIVHNPMGVCYDTSACFVVSIVVSTAEDLQQRLQVYPNPATDYLDVSLPGLTSAASLSLRNAEGKLLLEGTLPVTGATTMDVQSLPAGLYFLEVTTDKGSIIIKVARD